MKFFSDHTEGEPNFQRLFVGRRQELQTLAAHFKSGGRSAVVYGVRGSGKTMMVRVFAQTGQGLFPGGVYYTHAFGPETIDELLQRRLPESLSNRTLLILDDGNLMTKESVSRISSVLQSRPLLNVILVSTEPLDVAGDGQLSVKLGGLSSVEFYDLIKRRLADADPSRVQMFFELVGGNPLVAEIASRSIRDGIVAWDKLFQALSSFTHSGILGPDGKPYDPSLKVPPAIVVDARNTNDELLSLLKKNPEFLRSLPARKFEEIVAEILHKLGYEVELTPISGDGGFDIFAARKEAIGRFMYLVECKRYVPPNKVGVQVVRSLYGVVQQKNANAGIVVTTSFFTSKAKELEQELKHQIQLQDYIQVQKWLGLI